MTLSELAESLNLEIICKGRGLHGEVKGCVVCDILSHVVAVAKHSEILVTLQNSINVVAVAVLLKLGGIVLSENMTVTEEVIEKAEEQGVALLRSPEDNFSIACRINKCCEFIV